MCGLEDKRIRKNRVVWNEWEDLPEKELSEMAEYLSQLDGDVREIERPEEREEE
jgi:hypothetical protein